MARILKAATTEPENDDRNFWNDDPTLDFVCPNCEDILMSAVDGTLVWRCPCCGYVEMGREI